MRNYLYSFDKDSNHININDAKKGVTYYCPCCGDIMIPRKGDNNQWHYAHKNLEGNCSYESYLHALAKKRIRKCFENADKFEISLRTEVICSIKDCPLGTKQPCKWTIDKSHDLKQLYNKCKEEGVYGGFRADLLLTNDEKNQDPIFIEIYVSHKSTEKKLESKHQIIEIKIESEEDIDKITSQCLIKEDNTNNIDNQPYYSLNNKIVFYNFKKEPEKRLPLKNEQPDKFIFWIDNNREYRFDTLNNDYSLRILKCLEENPKYIDNAIFRIESMHRISLEVAFSALLASNLEIRYREMCKFYSSYYNETLCILCMSKGTPRKPSIACPEKCPHFELREFPIFHNKHHEYKVKTSPYNVSTKDNIKIRDTTPCNDSTKETSIQLTLDF